MAAYFCFCTSQHWSLWWPYRHQLVHTEALPPASLLCHFPTLPRPSLLVPHSPAARLFIFPTIPELSQTWSVLRSLHSFLPFGFLPNPLHCQGASLDFCVSVPRACYASSFLYSLAEIIVLVTYCLLFVPSSSFISPIYISILGPIISLMLK